MTKARPCNSRRIGVYMFEEQTLIHLLYKYWDIIWALLSGFNNSEHLIADKLAKFLMDEYIDWWTQSYQRDQYFFFFLISTCELFPINTVHIKNPSAFSN